MQVEHKFFKLRLLSVLLVTPLSNIKTLILKNDGATVMQRPNSKLVPANLHALVRTPAPSATRLKAQSVDAEFQQKGQTCKIACEFRLARCGQGYFSPIGTAWYVGPWTVLKVLNFVLLRLFWYTVVLSFSFDYIRR